MPNPTAHRDRRIRQRRIHQRLGLGLAAGLLVSACSSGGESTPHGVPGTGNVSRAPVSVVAQPEDEGKVVLDAITGATKTVDIPIYSIGGDEIESALKTAKSNGVDIRVMVNGGYGTYVAGVQGLYRVLEDAPGAGTVKVQWSSNNFSITHQKSVIVDAADENGNAVAADALPSSAKVVLSTGNYSGYDDTPFWAARDYDVLITNPELVNTIESVFVNDFSCPGTSTIYPQGLSASDRLVWSNGSTNINKHIPANQYPAFGVYSPFASDIATDQGNAKKAYLRIIKAAKRGDVLRFSNEELTDHDIGEALEDAAKKGVDVRIIMTLPRNFDPKDAEQAKSWNLIAYIVQAGGTAHMFENNADSGAEDALYVHGKFVALNSSRLMVGSANASFGSLLMNRELGINLTDADQQAIDSIVNTFDKDWARDDKWVTIWTKDTVSNPPWDASGSAPAKLAEAEVGPGVHVPRFMDDPPKACGPVR